MPVRNSSNQTIHFTTHAFCTCTEIHPGELELKPNETKVLNLVLDLSVPKHGVAGLSRSFSTSFELRDKVTNEELGSWAISGKVRDPLSVVKPIYYSAQESPEMPVQTFEITTLVPLQSLAVVNNPQDVEASVSSRTSDRLYELSMRPASKLEPGYHSRKLMLSPVALDGVSLPVVAVAVDINKEPDIRCLPSRLMFSAKASVSTSEVVVISSYSGAPFVLSEIAPKGEFSFECGTMGQAIASHRVHVAAEKGTAGKQRGSLDMILVDANGSKITRSVQLQRD